MIRKTSVQFFVFMLILIGSAVFNMVFNRGSMPFYCGPWDNNIICQLLRLVGLV